jgi:phosphatidylglycerophosphate synthase
MLDRYVIRLFKPALEGAATVLHKAGVRADQVTLIGFAVGIAAALGIAFHHPIVGLVLMLISRLGDGLDGPLARLTSPTDRGGFLDITLDFLFYASIPLAFAFADPANNALAASVLLAAFMGTATSFLAFATLAAQRGMKSAVYPNKGIYYLGGLTEATETLVCFSLMCVWPAQFALFAWVFAGLCVLTIVTRLVAGWRAFSSS